MAELAAGSTGRIFISYRRDETAYPAGWLYDRLANQYGDAQVFKDVDSIELGDDFVQVITTAVGSCDVLLALIGEQWLTLTDEQGGRRIDDPEDFVRLEIEAALTRNVRVIPILIDGARMPRADELPDSLVLLRRRQSLELSPSRFEYDTGRLMNALDSALAEARKGRETASSRTSAPLAGQDTAEDDLPAPAGSARSAPADGESAPRQPADRPLHKPRTAGSAPAGGETSETQVRPPLALAGPEAPVPAWLPTVCRAAGVALLPAALLPLLITESTTRWNLFAVFSPFEAVLASAALWLVAGALRGRRLPSQFAAGVLLSVGALVVAGALGLISYAGEWVGAVAVLLSLTVLVGGGAAVVAGVTCLRHPSAGSDGTTEWSMTGLALLGTALMVAALFLKYDGSSSLWNEVEEVSSAEFAYLPVTAVLLLVVADFLLHSRRPVAAGMLCATGALTSAHFVGVLLAATFAVGEVGEVRAAWVFGVAGGLIAAIAGWQTVGRSPAGQPAEAQQ